MLRSRTSISVCLRAISSGVRCGVQGEDSEEGGCGAANTDNAKEDKKIRVKI